VSIALRRVGVGLTWFFCFGVALFSYRYLVGGVEATMDFVAYHAAIRPMAFYAHVGLAPVALALVPFQLWHGLRRTRPMIHRTLGRLYGIAILISGAGGLWLAINTQAGPIAGWGFSLLALAWLGTTGMGIALAMRGNRAAHRRWMLRSVALTLAAVTLRLYIPLFMAADIPFDTAYSYIAWLCWVPNLVVVELYLRWRPNLVAASI
jgi:uncharacterized membrane protein YozB (DUF420 family)